MHAALRFDLCVCAWQQASETPFAAEAVQDGVGDQDGYGDQHSTIHEAAEDIANNWGKAPQPRWVEHRHKQLQQGMLAPPMPLSRPTTQVLASK